MIRLAHHQLRVQGLESLAAAVQLLALSSKLSAGLAGDRNG